MQNTTYFKEIIKRDGKTIVPFQPEKITDAIWKAARSVGGKDRKLAEELTLQVLQQLKKKGVKLPTVEMVQDVVEKVLVENRHYQTAKAYILYREKRSAIRDIDKAARNSLDFIKDYLQERDWRIRENSNMSFSLQGLNNHLTSAIVREYWLHEIYPEKIRRAHKDGDIHIHDLSELSAYCCGWDLQDFLMKGFGGVSHKIESNPPKHFQSALGQIVNFLFTLQGETAGAQAFSNFDTFLAPFVAYDRLSYDEVYQAMQNFIFNLNVPTRVGFQTPFTNLTMDLTCPDFLKDHPVIIGGELQEETYGQFQKEMDMINRAFAEVMLEGDAKGRVFAFPIPTYNITADFDWDNPVYEPIWEMTAKFGVPYFSNFINSDMKPEDVRSMCPLTGDTGVLVRSSKGIICRTIQEVYGTAVQTDCEYEVFANGKWYKADVKEFNPEKILKITLSNGDEIKMDSRHLQPARMKNRKIKTLMAKELKEGMYLPYNTYKINGDTEYSQYNAGYAVGAYIGDGSKDRGALVYSLSKDKKNAGIIKRLKKFFITMGFEISEIPDDNTDLLTLRVNGHSNAPRAWIEQFIDGNNVHEKKFKRKMYNMSSSFLEGVLDGWYATDGGNRGRIYITSKQLVEDFKKLCTFLGKGYNVVPEDNRDGRFGDNTVYVAKFHTGPSYEDWFFTEDNYIWFKIDKIEELEVHPQTKVYCFQVDSDEHLFTTASGLVTHNCRLRINNKKLRRRGGGLFGANPLTGSIGVCTINLPRLGYLSETKEEFLQRLEKLMEIARESLVIKRKAVENFTEQGLYPYARYYLQPIKERFGKYWSNHFNTIGIIGMNEACLNFLGKDIGSPEGQKFALEVLEFMRKKLVQFQEETDEIFNLEATPAEGTSYRLAKLDKELHPGIITANDDQDTPYYTNSTHLPVGYTDDIFTALDLQDRLQTMYTGGTVFHGFLGERMPDIQSTRLLVKKIAENYHLPYYTLTPTFSICPRHGYIKGEEKTCPYCGEETQVYSRIVGYITPLSQWNEGKKAEFNDRKTYKIS